MTLRIPQKARGRAHAALHGLQSAEGMSENQAYRWLQEAMSLSRRGCHIARFGPEQCEQVESLVNARLEKKNPPLNDDVRCLVSL